MTWYLYSPQVAKDGDTTAIAKSGSALVFAPSDFAGTAPLSPYSTAGLPLDFIEVGGDGLVQAFMLEDVPECLWISGQYRVPLVSFTGLFEDAQAAKVAAQAAQAAAQAAALAAAQNGSLPAGGNPGDVLTRALDLAPHWVAPISTGGGTSLTDYSQITRLANYPAGGFALTSHSHLIDDLRKAGSPASVALAAFMLQFLAAPDKATALSKIGAGSGTGNSNVTVSGATSGDAMPADKAFKANEIALSASITGVTGTNVQSVLAELAARGTGGGGTGYTWHIDYNFTTSTWPTRPATGGQALVWRGPTQPPTGGLYMTAGLDEFHRKDS